MKKTLSLIATVLAFALISGAVFAYGPVLKALPDVYIGNMEDNAGLTYDLGLYRFSDAFDLDAYVTDEDSTESELVWSFWDANNELEVNGLTELADPSDAANAAALGKDIRHPADAQFQPGNLVDFMVTRTPDPENFDKIVSFFVSDGLFVDSDEILVQSDQGGFDRISEVDPWELIRTDDFEGDTDSWVFVPLTGTTAPDFFAAATSSFDGSKLGVGGFDDSTNKFSFWYGPQVDYQANKLFKFAWMLSTSQANQDLVPTVRLRVNSAGFSYAQTMTLSSDGVTNPNAPTATPKVYNQYVMPLDTNGLVPYFDVYDFGTDAGAVYLEEMTASATTPNLDGWTADTVPAFGSWLAVTSISPFSAVSSGTTGGLQLASTVAASNAFGFWASGFGSGITLADGNVYRALFTVASSDTAPPNGYVRVSTGDLQVAYRLSWLAGTAPDADGEAYPLWFETQADVAGGNYGASLNFECADFEPDRGGTITLTDVTVVHSPQLFVE